MNEPTSFRGTPVEGSPGNRRGMALVAVLIVGFLGIAIAKPWGTPVASPSPASLPANHVAAEAAPTTIPTTTPVPSETPSGRPPVFIGLGADAFLTPAPPPATAEWTGISWHRLDPADPLSIVRTIVRWRGGFVAVGLDASGGSTPTPVWTSRGGTFWDPLPVGAPATFWPGLKILGVAQVRGGLVAVTELDDPAFCTAGPGCLPFMSWISTDGRTWTPRGRFTLGQANATSVASLVAVGPAGLVAVSSGRPPHAAISKDGVHWAVLPADSIPQDLVINDLRATADGYVAVGLRVTSTTRWDAATVWSPDGRAWTGTKLLPLAASSNPASAPAGAESTVVVSFVAGRGGMIAIGRAVPTPGTMLWWQSPDGRHWRVLPTFSPLGPIACPGTGCGGHPDGTLVGDGERMVAVRGGLDARAWTSADGLAWHPLGVTGDLPSEQATQAVIIPGGVLLSDGYSTWFGEAVTAPPG